MQIIMYIINFQSLHLLQQNSSQNGGNPPSNPGNPQQQNPAQATPTPQQLAAGNPSFFQGASPAMLQALLSQQQGGNHGNPIFQGIPPAAAAALNPSLANITDVSFLFFFYYILYLVILNNIYILVKLFTFLFA